MKLMNGEIFGAVTALNQMFEMELPVRTSLALAKLVGKLDEPFAAIEKVRAGLVKKYGKTNPKNNQTEVLPMDDDGEGNITPNENFPKFMEEYNELMIQETELVVDIVKLPQNIKGEPFVLKAALLIPLRKFVELETLEVVS
jgi:hypothetical protein